MPDKAKNQKDADLLEGGGDSGALVNRSSTKDAGDNESEGEGRQEDSSDDDEKEFEVQHFYVDWRIIYLQAHLQNLIGKPKYQLKQEKEDEFWENENNIIIKSFYERTAF